MSIFRRTSPPQEDMRLNCDIRESDFYFYYLRKYVAGQWVWVQEDRQFRWQYRDGFIDRVHERPLHPVSVPTYGAAYGYSTLSNSGTSAFLTSYQRFLGYRTEMQPEESNWHCERTYMLYGVA